MPQPVLSAVISHLNREAEIGGYEAAAEAASELDGVYDSVARLLGSGRDEVALTENAKNDALLYALLQYPPPGC